jgi:tRNA G18 (ribose-2'-O)-methylase SpoU
MKKLILIAHNVRSAHNVGSLLRTSDGLGVDTVVLSGYTPYPKITDDSRLPHEVSKIHKQIKKTALGAEDTQIWEHHQQLQPTLSKLKRDGYVIYALEQANGAIPLPSFKSPAKLALIVGREVEGIEPEILTTCDGVIEIPMLGQKESYNIVQAAAMALYHSRFVG